MRTHKPSLLQDLLLKDWGLSVGQLPRVYEAIKEFERNDGALNAVKSQTDKIKEQMLADRASALAEEQVLDREAALAEATAAWEASPFVVIAEWAGVKGQKPVRLATHEQVAVRRAQAPRPRQAPAVWRLGARQRPPPRRPPRPCPQ